MTHQMLEILYNTTLDNMDDKKANYFEYLLSMRQLKILSFIPTAFAGLFLAVGIACSIINLSIYPFAVCGVFSTITAGIGTAMFVASPHSNDYNITRQEYKAFVKSGGRKRIKTLLKEYRKNIKSNPLTNEEKEIVRLDILQNNLELTKQEKLNTIAEAQKTISDVEEELSKVKTKKENLIKQLSERKAAEKVEQANAEQVVKHNTEKVADEQEEIKEEKLN